MFWIFLFKIRTGFCNASTFSWPGFANKKRFDFYFTLFSVISESRGLEKSYSHVSDNAFQIGKVTINPNTKIR